MYATSIAVYSVEFSNTVWGAEVSKQHYLSMSVFTHCNAIHFLFNEKKSILRALIYPEAACIAPETVDPWILEEESVITAGTQCDTLSGSLAIKCSRLIVLRPEEARPSQAFILLPETT